MPPFKDLQTIYPAGCLTSDAVKYSAKSKQMNDAEFREQYQPVHVPASFHDANTLQDKVIFALAELGEGTAEEVTIKLERLEPSAPAKQVIAAVHEVLSALHGKGLISASETEGNLKYNLHKVTEANGGKINPGLLSPGLD